MKDDMVMFGDFGSLMVKTAGHALCIIRFNAKRTGHAKMADNRQPVIQMHGQIFRTASQRLDTMA